MLEVIEKGSCSTSHPAPLVFVHMGHNMMLEPGWQAVAERIDNWLTARGL